MESSATAERGRMRKRELGTQFSVGSTSLSLGAILGIAIGGALLLFTILVLIGIIHIKRKHRREKQHFLEANEGGNGDIDLKTALRSIRPPEMNTGRRLSFNPFLPLSGVDTREEFTVQDGLQKPPLAKSRSITRRSFFRTSGIRDSWPLMPNKPLGFLPGQTGMMLSQVAPPGYLIQDSKWPKRTSSILGRKNSQDSKKSTSPTRDPYPMDVMPYKKIHRRSTSENQLSTILRSTSHRLKAAHRNSLTRTISALGQFPGLPPSERLPTPPLRKATESREGLIDQENIDSVGSSIYDVWAETPSPKKKHQWTSSKRSPIKPKSPSESIESKDSLCMSDTPDIDMPAPLTSPSKSPSRSQQKKFQSRASGGAKDISTLIHQDSRVSLCATGPQEIANNTNILSPPQCISLSGDPFYSSVRSFKPTMPETQIQGPRPMYFRKATFGQEATSERPVTFCSPLRDISGNAQPSKRELPEPPTTSEPNPFQWFPKDAMQIRATQTSPKRLTSRGKGHKRSNVIRMKNLALPVSTVDIVPEEPDDGSALKFNVPRYSSFVSIETPQDLSPANSLSNRRTNMRPPSSATFNPTLIVPALSSRSEDNPPTLGSDGVNENAYLQTLSVCDYNTEKDSGSEDEFFKSRVSTSLQPSPSVIKSRLHGRNSSADLALFPTHQSQQYLQQRLLSFPQLPAEILPAKIATPPPQILTPRPTSRLLPNITSTMNGLRSTAETPAPPILTIPSHLNGPRSEPGKHTRATLSPPRGESMLSTISMLRRMNSDVSAGSYDSVARCDSPTLPIYSPTESMPTGTSLGLGLNISIIDEANRDNTKHFNSNTHTSIEKRGRSRGSQHYISLGQYSSPSNGSSSTRHRRDKARQGRHSRNDIRDSHRIHKERRKRRTEELEGGGMINELESVQERESLSASAAIGVNAVVRGSRMNGLRFPTLSREGSLGLTPPPRSSSRLRGSGLRLGSGIDITIAGGLNDTQNGGTNKKENNTVLQSIETDPLPEDTNRYSLVLSEKSGNEGQRWSDAMTKPTAHVTRDDRRMEHPSPVTPPKWMVSGLDLAGVRLMERDVVGRIGFEQGDGSICGGRIGGSRPESLGLYDQEGFLKGSPEKEEVSILAGRVAEERREWREVRGRELVAGFVI